MGTYLKIRLTAVKLSLVVVAAAQFWDVLSTNRALGARDGLYEANPLVRLHMDAFGDFWWLPKLLIAALCVVLAVRIRRPSTRAALLTVGVAAAYLAAVAHNLYAGT